MGKHFSRLNMFEPFQTSMYGFVVEVPTLPDAERRNNTECGETVACLPLSWATKLFVQRGMHPTCRTNPTWVPSAGT